MISATCPSCSAPLSFPHGAVRVIVCGACDSTVVREDLALRDIGKRSPILRELSPIQVGARGYRGDRSFEVIGGLRKGRERVRWNEWYLLYSDGSTGWLGEGNGQFFLFEQSVPAPQLELRQGQVLELAGISWRVGEAAEAEVLAHEGALPVVPRGRARYADLRTTSRTVATWDGAEQPPLLWIGKVVELAELKMEGLRPFLGWSDPVLVRFAGPQIEALRSLTCPACSSAIQLRAPGQSRQISCPTCGAALAPADAAEAAPQVLRQGRPYREAQHIELGVRGQIEDVPVQVIGTMDRYVTEEGQDWHWQEYLTWNPYRGYWWLVRDSQGRWNVVKLLDRVPEELSSRDIQVELPGTGQRGHFRYREGGQATVAATLGEFTWEVQAGDEVSTADYFGNGWTLSREEAMGEVTWSLGRPMSAAELTSFGLKATASSATSGTNLFAVIMIMALFTVFCCIGLVADGTGGSSSGVSSGGWSSGK